MPPPKPSSAKPASRPSRAPRAARCWPTTLPTSIAKTSVTASMRMRVLWNKRHAFPSSDRTHEWTRTITHILPFMRAWDTISEELKQGTSIYGEMNETYCTGVGCGIQNTDLLLPNAHGSDNAPFIAAELSFSNFTHCVRLGIIDSTSHRNMKSQHYDQREQVEE